MLIKKSESGLGISKITTEVYDNLHEFNARIKDLKDNTTAIVTSAISKDIKAFTVIIREQASNPNSIKKIIDSEVGKFNCSDPTCSLILSRLENISIQFLNELKDSGETALIESMSDVDLAKFLFEKEVARSTKLTTRQQRLQYKLNEGAVKFSQRLKELGGCISKEEAAKVLEISVVELDKLITSNKVLDVTVAGEHVIPVFQFTGGKIVEGVGQVLSLIKDFSSTTKVSFLTSLYFFDGEQDLNAIDAMKQYGTKDHHFKEIRRQASLFGRHIAS